MTSATRVFAIEWLKRIAQGFSPGFAMQGFDLKGRPTVSADPHCKPCILGISLDWIAVKSEAIRSPLQGVRVKKPYPGLKPWASLFSRFAAGGANHESLPRTLIGISGSHQSRITNHQSPTNRYVVPTFI
jgi:hypothetical protein